MLSGFRWFDNPRFMGAQGQQTAKWLQIDFMKRRKLWFAISGVIVIAGAVSLGVRGLNLGIDFKGGTQITFKTPKPHSTDDIRKIAAAPDVERPDAIVQGRGTSVNGDYTTWQVRTRALSQAEQNAFQLDLKQKVGAFASGTKNVSSSFGRQIAKDAIWGIIVSLVLIVIYIALRFDIKFAVPVIVAMLHDIVITVGVYSIAFKEVSIATVAAVLTVLGYSIYDTIIIFDRVRENIPLMRRQSFATITNVSLWETIRRSLATTFITLLPVIALEVLGGATLKDFAFALIVGVISGAYSSIFIAAPLLCWWKEREPEYAKRKRFAGDDEIATHGRRRRQAAQGRRGHGRAGRVGRRAGRRADAGARRRHPGIAVRAGRPGAPREAPPAPAHEAAWPRAVATGSSRSSRSCSSSSRAAARQPHEALRAGARRRSLARRRAEPRDARRPRRARAPRRAARAPAAPARAVLNRCRSRRTDAFTRSTS